MIVLDASVLIAFLDADDAHHPSAERLLRDAVDDGLAASSLTIAEVLVTPTRVGRVVQTLKVLTALGVEDVPLPRDAAGRLAACRVDTGLRMPDCCVLVTAETAGASMASFDGRLVREARRRGLRVVDAV